MRAYSYRWMPGAVLVLALLVAAEGAGLLRPPETAPPAPEVESPVWINSAPLRLADLRGKVILVEFWTYG
ncbi:MAG: hypothetical protein HY576_06295 [candidate division NC10 bacterium]|nr:hypothetical protein [candidate division NC10 bacterium]